MKTYTFGKESSNLVLVQLMDDFELKSIEEEISYIKENSKKDFMFLAIKVDDWNKDLSPWEAPAIFGKEDFKGGADKTLEEVLKICSDTNKTYYLGGYSLSALFAIYASTKTDRFKRINAASPSMWFLSFTNYLKTANSLAEVAYFSLGDKEEHAKNKALKTVGDRLQEAVQIFKENSIDTYFEYNPGNHFVDAPLRTAKGFVYLLQK